MKKIQNYLSILIVCILLLGTFLPAINGISLQKQSFSEIKPSSISGKSNAVFTKDLSILNKRYAVIIVGCYGTGNSNQTIEETERDRIQHYRWYLNDAQEMYNVLMDQYGYDNEHIYVLITKIEDYPTPNGFEDSIIDFPSTKLSIKKVFDGFKNEGENELNEEDSLFVVFIDHGADGHQVLKHCLKKWFNQSYPEKILGKNDTFFALEPRYNFIFKNILEYDFFSYAILFANSLLWEYQFARYIAGIEAKVTFALQPCMSGGFINALSGKNRIVCTASTEKELADCWIGPFRCALNKIDEYNNIDGEPNPDGIPDADRYPEDGSISILEAYRYAAEYAVSHSQLGSQHSLIDDNADGIGHFYNETGYDPDDPDKDGYLAARTFL